MSFYLFFRSRANRINFKTLSANNHTTAENKDTIGVVEGEVEQPQLRSILSSSNLLTVYSVVLIKILDLLDPFSLENFYRMVVECELENLDLELCINYKITERLDPWFCGKFEPRPTLSSCVQNQLDQQRALQCQRRQMQSSNFSVCICSHCTK